MEASKSHRLAAIFLALGLVPIPTASQATQLRPMTVRQFDILRRAAENPADGFWASVAFDNYMIGLFEGFILLTAPDSPTQTGQSFCLPAAFTTGSAADVFFRLRAELDVAIGEAGGEELVAPKFLAHLYQMFPC
jgi:hypothetical protein